VLITILKRPRVRILIGIERIFIMGFKKSSKIERMMATSMTVNGIWAKDRLCQI
jgi:hypothetical protein